MAPVMLHRCRASLRPSFPKSEFWLQCCRIAAALSFNNSLAMVYLPPTERSDLVRCNAEETAAPTHAGFPHPHVGRLAYRPSQGVQKVCQRLELESKVLLASKR